MSTEIAALFEQLRFSLAQPSRDLFSDSSPVFIYGAGGVGKDVYRLLTQRGINVTAFLDRAALPGATWQGIPVYRPDDPALTLAQRQRAHTVIGIFNAHVEMPPIERLLTTLGYSRVTSFLDLHDAFATDLGDRFWLTARSFYLNTEASCAAAYELLSDETSRALFASILQFRFAKDYGILPAPGLTNQYFDQSLPAWAQPLRFIDCGAYNGDTIEHLRKTGLAVESIAAFEPDLANFVKLSQYVDAHREGLPKEVYLYPCGVDSSSRQLRFSSAQGAGSHLDESGDTVIQCVSIDEALHGFAPNVIKMDIEGAEVAALWGARRTIAEHRPGLAICLYHRPEHLWQIPRLVAEWYGDRAKYYLRSHCYNGFDLVLYVLPS